jgi:hypothetical protein
VATAHLDLRDLRGDALALGHRVVSLPEAFVAGFVLDVHHFVVGAFLQPQAAAFDALRDHGRPTDHRRSCQTFADDDLRRPQHTLLLGLRISHALRGGVARVEDGLHRRAGGIEEGLQALAVRR